MTNHSRFQKAGMLLYEQFSHSWWFIGVFLYKKCIILDNVFDSSIGSSMLVVVSFNLWSTRRTVPENLRSSQFTSQERGRTPDRRAFRPGLILTRQCLATIRLHTRRSTTMDQCIPPIITNWVQCLHIIAHALMAAGLTPILWHHCLLHHLVAVLRCAPTHLLMGAVTGLHRRHHLSHTPHTRHTHPWWRTRVSTHTATILSTRQRSPTVHTHTPPTMDYPHIRSWTFTLNAVTDQWLSCRGDDKS